MAAPSELSGQGLPAPPPAGPARPGEFRRAMNWLPQWAVALLVLAPAMVVEHCSLMVLVPGLASAKWVPEANLVLFLLALFLAGPVKRLNGRHALIMLPFAAAAFAVSQALEHVRVPRIVPFPAPQAWCAELAATVLLLGLGEMVVTRRRSWRALARLAVAGLAVAAFLSAAVEYVALTDWQVYLGGNYSVAGRIAWPLEMLLAWLAVPAALAPGASRARRAAERAAVAGAALVFIGFYGVLLYPLAEHSAYQDGPFPRYRGALVLEGRGLAADFEHFLKQLEEADWAGPAGIASQPDWRGAYIHILSRHDPDGAAARLSALLAASPTPALAGLSAHLLARTRRYEAAPLLVRFALTGPAPYRQACAAALREMKVPQAAYPVLREVAEYGEQTGEGTDEGADFEVPPLARAQLAEILGRDAGADFSQWQKLYEESAGAAGSPLPESARAETDAVIRCFADYWEYRRRWRDARETAARRMLADDGKEGEIAAFEDWNRRQATGPPGEQPGPEVVAGYRIVRAYLAKARDAMAVEEPDWNVPTADDLAGEIAAYGVRVEAAIENSAPPAGPAQPE